MDKLIKIISCEPSEKGNWSEITYKDDGKPFSKNIFPPLEAIAQANVGKEMMATFTKKDDKYWNITALADPSAAPAPVAQESGTRIPTQARSADTDKRIAEQVAIKAIAEVWAAGRLDKTDKLVRKMCVWCDNALGDVKIPILNKDGNNPLKPTDGQVAKITELLQKQIDDGILTGYDDGECAFRAMVDLDYGGTLTMEDADQWYKKLLQAEKKAKK